MRNTDRGNSKRNAAGGYSDRAEARAMPLPRSLTHLKREIAKKKWAEARQWAGGGTSRKKYWMPSRQNLDSTVAGSSKRLASRFCQLKTGHCSTVQYLQATADEGPPYRPVLVVPVSDADAGRGE